MLMTSEHFESLKAFFYSGQTRPLAYRKQQLKNLLRFLKECENDIAKALEADLRKPHFEALTSEIGVSRAEIRYALANLNRWAQPKQVSTPITQIPASCSYAFEPKGVVLVIGPWNFPLQLNIIPLASALAAGNTVIVKLSEHAPHTSAMLASLLPRYLDSQCVRIVEGDHLVSQELLQMQFDHIFFTGSTRIGRIVMQEAAKNLIPVTLELGGKCPTIVDESADISLAATRILWGKLINAGQVCLAPDFVLVHSSLKDKLIEALKRNIQNFYGQDVAKSSDYARIISCDHASRLARLLIGHNVIFGGVVDANAKYVSPTLVLNPSLDSPLMEQEIFGPILPIIEYSDLNEVKKILSKMGKPLALYIFSKNKKNIQKIESENASGAVCINDTVSHVAVPTLPFGGVGASGMGTSHGEDGFQAFSYKRAYFDKATFYDLPLRYAPYTKLKARIAGWFL